MIVRACLPALTLALAACLPPCPEPTDPTPPEQPPAPAQGTPDYACEVGLNDPAVEKQIETLLDAIRQAPLNPDDPSSPTAEIGGVVVAYAPPGGPVRVQAFGTTKPGGETPLSHDAVFDVGSIQKNVQWMVLHRLVEEGLLDLDAEVNSVLPSPVLPGATFRQLTMHTSGLKHWDDTPTFSAHAFDCQCSWFELETVMGHLEADGPPLLVDVLGGPFHYSNYGPLIAAEAATMLVPGDATPRSLARDLLLLPMGLYNTTFQGYEPQPERLTPGFWADGTPHTWTDDYVDTRALSSAAGSLIYTDACDLARYGRGLFVGDAALEPQTLFDLFSEVAVVTSVEEDGTVEDVGFTAAGLMTYLGVEGNPVDGLWGHLGSGQHGHSSAFLVDPDTGTTFVVLANVASDPVVSDPLTGEPRYGAGYDTQFHAIGALRALAE